MKILFAAPDRDLLECYKQLFEADLGQTAAAFDGTQALALLSAEDFDIVILDRNIPRVDHRKITEHAKSRNIPVIVLTDGSAGALSAEEPRPDGRLSYPFTYPVIKKTVRDTLRKQAEEERTGQVTADE